MKSVFRHVLDAKLEVPVRVEKLASDLGIKVKTMELPDNLSGRLVKAGDEEYEIHVNSRHAPTRRRFTIAHELGHYVLHRPLLGDGITDNTAYRAEPCEEYHNHAITQAHETQANQFAAELLMPRDTVEKLKAEGASVDEMAKRLEVSRHAMSIRAGVPYLL